MLDTSEMAMFREAIHYHKNGGLSIRGGYPVDEIRRNVGPFL